MNNRKYEKVFGIADYEKAHRLVYEYQDGSELAAEELIKNFKSFLDKYVSLIKRGKYDIFDSSIRSFMKLFVEDASDRKRINAFQAKGLGKAVADKAMYKIVDIFSNTDDEDVMQDLISIFLIMCSKYKDTKPSIHHHINCNFHYYAYRYFEKTTRDPIARAYVETLSPVGGLLNSDVQDNDSILENLIQDGSTEIQMEEMLNEVELYYNVMMSETPTMKTNKKVSIYEDSFLNINWINGITCSDIFKTLTAFQRKIIVMWYINNKTDSDIAEEFGVCRGTINKRRALAKTELEKAVIKSKHIKI